MAPQTDSGKCWKFPTLVCPGLLRGINSRLTIARAEAAPRGRAWLEIPRVQFVARALKTERVKFTRSASKVRGDLIGTRAAVGIRPRAISVSDTKLSTSFSSLGREGMGAIPSLQASDS